MLTLLGNVAFGQPDSNTDFHTIGINIPHVAILDIEPAASKNITMNFTAPTEAGDPLTAPVDNSTLWLNYSVIKNSGKTYKISVKVNAVLSGIDIKVTAAGATGDGAGVKGTPSGQLTLIDSDQTILDYIESVWTGDGDGKGHKLTYNIGANSTGYGDIVAAVNTATVTYTIAEN